ncbi:hypothetical protein [Roseomonas chloroacetimidivorans]|uniref:hypothetical protein n=1 Tax=Roseomonas chloroacetimidivorans TaxID=1766656 RepID=UPI003C737882
MKIAHKASRDMQAVETVQQAARALNEAIQAALGLGLLVGIKVHEDEVQNADQCNPLVPPSVEVVVDKP